MSSEAKYIADVPFRIFDFSASDESMQTSGLEPGFYYDIPLTDEEKVNPAEIMVAGPYKTATDARDAAIAFIEDALTEHKDAA